jgi:hypothetical protein
MILDDPPKSQLGEPVYLCVDSLDRNDVAR